MLKLASIGLTSIAALLLSACGTVGPVESGRIAIVGAKLVPGGSAPVIDYSIVLIDSGKFQAVGSQATVPLPKDATVVDGLGKTIEPPDAAAVIQPGSAANLVLKSGDGSTRTMREGQWLQ